MRISRPTPSARGVIVLRPNPCPGTGAMTALNDGRRSRIGERQNGHRYQIPEDAVYMQNSVQCRLEPGEEILRRALLIHHLTRREAVICRYGGVPLGHNGNELSARRLHARRI